MKSSIRLVSCSSQVLLSWNSAQSIAWAQLDNCQIKFEVFSSWTQIACEYQCVIYTPISNYLSQLLNEAFPSWKCKERQKILYHSKSSNLNILLYICFLSLQAPIFKEEKRFLVNLFLVISIITAVILLPKNVGIVGHELSRSSGLEMFILEKVQQLGVALGEIEGSTEDERDWAKFLIIQRKCSSFKFSTF